MHDLVKAEYLYRTMRVCHWFL